eukprot:scaffold10997_cov216-Amphora_coffeaeformis.AAC.3
MLPASILSRRGAMIVLDTMKLHPILTNSISGCILFGGSDALAQWIEHGQRGRYRDFHGTTEKSREEFHLNCRRMLTTGALGIFFSGYIYPRACTILDRTRTWPKTTYKHVVTKSLVEIATVGIFMNATSLAARGVLVGRDFRGQVAPHVLHEMPRVTLNDLRVWFPYNLVAFAFVAAYVRPTTTAAVNASWQTYISLRSHDYHGTSY